MEEISYNINDNNETLFWKVIHNKVIFRNIIDIIKNTEIHHSNNRISFSQLNTLEILVKTKNFQLLKYKLLSPNEHVYISKNGINELFKVKVIINGKDELQILLKEILDILLSQPSSSSLTTNGKRNQFEICNLVEVAIKNNNEFILDILINEPYKLQLYPKSLEYSIQYTNLSTFKKLMKLQPIITKSFKSNSIKHSSKNKYYFKEMLEFILENEDLYNKEYTGDVKDKPNNQVLLPIFSQLNLKSQNKLFDMDMISAKPRGNYKFEFPSFDDNQLSPQEVFLKYKLFCKFQFEFNPKAVFGKEIFKLIKEIEELDQPSLTGFEILSFKLKSLENAILQYYPLAIRNRNNNCNVIKNDIKESEIVIDKHKEFIDNIIKLNFDNNGIEDYIKNQDKIIQFEFDQIHSEQLRTPTKLYHSNLQVNYYNGKCTIEKLLSIIELLINSKLVSTPSYKIIIVYLFDKLIQFKNVTINQVLQIHKLLEYNSIEIKHELYHSFFYLNLKDSRLSKFIIDIFENHSDGFIGKTKINTISKHYIFTNSFDQILDKLLSQLFHDMFDEMKGDPNNCFFTSSMNSILIYCLEIKRFDLFFKHLQFIQDQIDSINNGDNNGSLEDSGFPVLRYIKTSSIQPIPPKLKLIPVEMYDLQYPFPKYINTFNFSDKLYLLITLMDIENVIKFIEFGNIKYQLTSMFQLYNQSLLKSRFDIIKILLQDYKLPIGSINFSDIMLDETYDKFKESKLIIETNYHYYKDPIEFEISKFNLFYSIFSNQFLKFVNSFFFNSRNRSSYNKFIKGQETDSRYQILKEIFTDVKKIFNDKLRSIESLIGDGTLNAKIVDLLQQQMPQQQLGTPMEQISFFQIYKSDQIQSFINSLFKEYESERINEIKSTFIQNENNNNNLFSNSFIFGNIEKCNLILNYYPNYFKITKHMMTVTIQNQNIHIIKYYYKNINSNLINSNFKNSDPDLILHLKKELSNHFDYKYDLNWLK